MIENYSLGIINNGWAPNITGYIDAGYSHNSNFLGLFNSGSGCFAVSGNYNQRYASVLEGGANYTGMSFDASRSSDIYHNQVNSIMCATLTMLYIIKY